MEVVDSTSKLGSVVKINSIAIDISSSMEVIESPAHEHFSIRGFVAGMRKKDLKTCFPFASLGNNVNHSRDNLPPLFVPEFRWWQCSDCIPNAETKRTTEKKAVVTKSDANTSSCENVVRKNGLRDKTGKTYIRDIEARNSCDMPEVNLQQAIKSRRNSPDAPLCIVDESDNASSGSDDTFSVLPHKRKPKSRSLADILVGEKNQTSSNSRTRSASSCGMQVASSKTEAASVPQFEVAKARRSPERKRKIALGEESEDRERLASMKRPKGLVVDGEKNSKRAMFFDPESKGGDSMRPKKLKCIDTSKKMRRIYRDDEMDQTLPKHTNLGKLGEMRPCFRSSLARQQSEKVDVDRLVPLSKSTSRNQNIRGEVALGVSLNGFMDNERNPNSQESCRERRCIPDLNMEIPENNSMTEDQEFTILSEKRSLPLHRKMDASSSCRNEDVTQGKQQMGKLEPKNKDNSNVEVGASDDIPMEIVELLARNQHERSLGNSRRHLPGINNSTRGYSAVTVYEQVNFPLPSRTNGFTVKNGNMGVGTSTNLPQLKHCQFDTSRPAKYHFSSPSQLRKPEDYTSTSITIGARSDTTAAPFRLSIPHNRPIQPCGKHYLKDSKGKKVLSDVAKLREERFGSMYPSLGSLDPYSNDSIPAMQLLSLMDQRVKSSPSFEVGTKSFLNKPFSPCKHHPRNGKENNLSWLHYGVYSSGESSERVQVPQELRNPKTNLLEGSRNLEKRPARSNGALGECTVNKNPADFSIPEVGNQFTLTAKDLKHRKRQRRKKNALEKECLRS